MHDAGHHYVVYRRTTVALFSFSVLCFVRLVCLDPLSINPSTPTPALILYYHLSNVQQSPSSATPVIRRRLIAAQSPCAATFHIVHIVHIVHIILVFRWTTRFVASCR